MIFGEDPLFSKVKVTPNDLTTEKQLMKCNATQIPINASNAITGHKLQGLTYDNLVVYSLNKSTDWIYVIFSHVRTFPGLYLFRSLKLRDIKPLSQDSLAFLEWMKTLQEHDSERFRRNQCGE